jgi:alpha-glucosidase
LKKYLFVLVFFMPAGRLFALDTLKICSPSGNICVKVWMDGLLKYQIDYGDKTILEPSGIDLVLKNGNRLSDNKSIRSHRLSGESEQIISPVPEKRRIIQNDYSRLVLKFRNPFRVEFRVYDDAVAYRISTQFKDSIIIKNELAEFRFPGRPSAWFAEMHKRQDADIFHTSFEELYPHLEMDRIPDTCIAYSPVLVDPQAGPKIAITESDLEDYPGMFLGGTGASALKGVFAGYPLKEKLTDAEYAEAQVVQRADYIAVTNGSRDFPWRVLMIAAHDRDLPSNDVVYRLAAPSAIGDASWVKPGKGTDEWIIDVNLFHVPFKSGINTSSYKYYIDFAKRFGFDRIMMDAGWSDHNDLFKINPDIDMDTLSAYARKQGIRISMWTLANTLNRQLDSALAQFNKWGVDFIMTDFIDRNDQPTVDFYRQIAKACADHHIMIMFHGAFPPGGFNRTFPNAVTREGVLGSEYNIWSDLVTPSHDLILPFTRMLAGPFDYEPGLLNNATQKGFRAIGGMPMSQGTRCHQLAMFIVYDNPMQIFSGNPSQALTEPQFMEFLGSIPTVWDETLIPEAAAGEYIITARKKDQDWFIGGMTNWTARDFSLALDFLGDGNYRAEIVKDGINADRYAADYTMESIPVTRKTVLPLHLAPGGGFAIRISRMR